MDNLTKLNQHDNTIKPFDLNAFLPKVPCECYPEFFCGCCSKTEKRDCFFYHEEPDMGGHIPTCSYYKQLGYCPCGSCNKYLNIAIAFAIIKKHVDKLQP